MWQASLLLHYDASDGKRSVACGSASSCFTKREVCAGFCIKSSHAAAPCAGASRWAALGASTVALLGLLNLNINGPGITATVKSLWKSPDHKA
jgi:hypothetical protein